MLTYRLFFPVDSGTPPFCVEKFELSHAVNISTQLLGPDERQKYKLLPQAKSFVVLDDKRACHKNVRTGNESVSLKM